MIDKTSASWAYELGQHGGVNPFDPKTTHAVLWHAGRDGKNLNDVLVLLGLAA